MSTFLHKYILKNDTIPSDNPIQKNIFFYFLTH